MLNKVMIIGRLGRDPELRYTQSGSPICNLNIATDESYTDRDGNKVDRAEWHRVVVFQRAAETAHGVAFEVGEPQDGVVVVQMCADEIFLELLAAGDGKGEIAVLVHDVAGGDVHKAVFLHGLPVSGCGVAAALIGGVAPQPLTGRP